MTDRPSAGSEEAPARPIEVSLRQWRERRPLVLIAALVALAMVAGALALQRVASTPPPASAGTATPAPRPQARGQVRPVAQARVGSLAGGVVASIALDVGDAVGEQQEIARIRGQAGTEVLTAPIRGTITGIPVHVGDTLLPGTIVATVADVSRLQVETTDVDEFLMREFGPVSGWY